MDITATALGQAVSPTAQVPTVGAAAPGFAFLLGAIQSGAPPGAAPPTAGAKVEEEVANLGQTALSLNPDFLPAAEKTPNADKDAQRTPAKAAQVDPIFAMMSLTASIGAMQTAMPVLVQKAFAAQPKADAIKPIVATPAEATVAPAPTSPALELLPDGTINPSSIPNIPPAPPVSGYADKTVPISEPIQKTVEVMPAVDTRDADLGRGKPRQAISTSQPDAVQLATDRNVRANTATQVVAEVPPELKATVASTTAPVKQTPADKPKADATGAKSVTTKSDSTAVKTTDAPKVEAKSGVVEVDDREVERPTKVDAPKSAPVVEPSPVQSVKTEAVQPKQALPRRDVNLVIRQVVDRIELMAATRPKGGVTIQLQPERLGTITMTVKSVAGSVDAHITASNDNVRTALDQNRGMLSQSLEQRGLKLENVSVAAQTNTSTYQRDAQQQQQQQQAQQRSHQQAMTAGREVRSAAASNQRQSARSVDGVDLWI